MHDQLYDDPKRLMRRKEIAAFRSVAVRTVDRWFATKKLKRVQIGAGISGATRRADVIALADGGDDASD